MTDDIMRHNSDGVVHVPVLWREVRQYLSFCNDIDSPVIVDATMGEGGHTKMILDDIPRATVYTFERDPFIRQKARKRLAPYGDRVTFIEDNFATMSEYLEEEKGKVHAFLFDFGISSYHYDESGRGFAIAHDEPLDMRLDGEGESAADIVNTRDADELADIFFHYGDERYSRRIARRIVEERQKNPLETTGQLSSIVMKARPSKASREKIHPATRVFQALRIYVNNELEAVEKGLHSAVDLVAPSGRIIAISFHSLEDRIAKNVLRDYAGRGRLEEYRGAPLLKILTKKPLAPGEEELSENNRARSAKMRVAEKVGSVQ